MKRLLIKAAVRSVSAVLSAVMCLTVVTADTLADDGKMYSSFASISNTSGGSDDGPYISVEECKLAGQKWITANYPDNTEIRSIIPIKSLDDRLSGYCINFSTDGEPSGYLVLDAEKYADTYIKEFALDGNGIYDELAANITANSDTKTVAENVIYATDPYQYAIKYTKTIKHCFVTPTRV